MSYTDEKMIKVMNAHKEGVQGSIGEGITIREELYIFGETQLFDGRMQVMLPQSFQDMPSGLARLKYPMEQRPQVIRTNERTDINFTFSLPDQPLENSQVKPLRETQERRRREQ